MSEIDQINIHFDNNQVFLLNICLGILMFGVAIDLKWSDFTYILGHSKSIFAGLISQWIWLPLITIGLVWLIHPEYSLALGMILIAACPGGNVSNYTVHLANANAALSVMLTMISTLLCAFSTPLIFSLLRSLLPHDHLINIHFEINFLDMVITIVQLIILPLIIGFLMSYYFPNLVGKIKKMVRNLSLLIFIGFVIAAVAGNLDNLKNYIGEVFFIVLIHNGLALLLGYFWSKKLIGLNTSDARTISIETGIQNSGLALILIFNFFDGLGGMALIAAWWSIWHLISALALALYWKRNLPNEEVVAMN